MKKYLLAFAIATSGLLSTAFANDFCCPVQYDPCCCNGVDFNGFYVGGNLGVITHTAHRNDLDGFTEDNSGFSTNSTNFTAGVQVGYDWQCCNKLFGLVVDWNWSNARRRLRIEPSDPTEDQFIHSRHHWFTTIRARAGITVCDALFYVTGGAAVTRFNNRWREVPDEFRDNHTRWGWVGGVGTELMLGCSWSLGAEVLFLHFSDHTRTFTSIAGDVFQFSHSDSVYVGRILLNYRFGDLCSFCCR